MNLTSEVGSTIANSLIFIPLQDEIKLVSHKSRLMVLNIISKKYNKLKSYQIK